MTEPRLPCDAFRRNPDGTWTCIKRFKIIGPQGEVEFREGITFSRGMTVMGFPVVELLEKHCA